MTSPARGAYCVLGDVVGIRWTAPAWAAAAATSGSQVVYYRIVAGNAAGFAP